jgi:DNA-binding transcriptional regulator YhcF (GntR family)
MRSTAQDPRLRVDRTSEVPLGTQLAWKLRSLVDSGELAAHDRLPSVRDLATAAGVNVNTVRTVYGRLEAEGLIHSEQGRGTFVTAPGQTEDRATRQDLRQQIAALEAELVGRAQAPRAPGAADTPRAAGGRLPTTDELRAIRDQLLDRLRELDQERSEVLHRLAELEGPEAGEAEPAPDPSRRSSVSLRGARVRWVGA